MGETDTLLRGLLAMWITSLSGEQFGKISIQRALNT